jgi:hypothetical protein
MDTQNGFIHSIIVKITSVSCQEVWYYYLFITELWNTDRIEAVMPSFGARRRSQSPGKSYPLEKSTATQHGEMTMPTPSAPSSGMDDYRAMVSSWASSRKANRRAALPFFHEEKNLRTSNKKSQVSGNAFAFHTTYEEHTVKESLSVSYILLAKGESLIHLIFNFTPFFT